MTTLLQYSDEVDVELVCDFMLGIEGDWQNIIIHATWLNYGVLTRAAAARI